MNTSFRVRLIVYVLLGVVLLALNATVSYRNLDRLISASQRVDDTRQVLRLLARLLVHVVDAESGQRGYLITGQPQYLEPYQRGARQLSARIAELRQFLAADAEQRRRLDELEVLVAERLEELDRTIEARRNGGLEAAAARVGTDRGRVLMDGIRSLLDDMRRREEALLANRAAQADSDATVTLVTFLVATLGNMGLLAVIAYIVLRENQARQRVAAAQQVTNERLAQTVREIEQRNTQMTLFSQMSSFLQSCTNSEEACTAIAQLGPRLFPSQSGALYLFHASHNFLELAASWGDAPPGEQQFGPDDCWALRRGRPHNVRQDVGGLTCKHVTASESGALPYLCMPLMAQGEMLGLLHLRPASVEDGLQLVAAVAEQVGLALANLRLRETLRQQSIRDQLTGLYNRRFLEESLDRELARVERRRQPLSILMIDVDDFKVFNDTYGHEAGDVVLHALGLLLRRHARQSDVACRFGGEEFTLLLPETSAATAQQRAERLREAVSELKPLHAGQPLGTISLSIGVASFPEHGHDRETLLHAADMALYEAKRGGRNRVTMAATLTDDAHSADGAARVI